MAREDKDAGRGTRNRQWVTPDSRRGVVDPGTQQRGVKVEEVMTTEVVETSIDSPADEAARIMRDHNIGFLPISQYDGTVVGVLTDRDLVVRLLAERRSPDTRVEEVMTSDPVSCHAGDDLAVAESLMRANQISRLVVLGDDDLLSGVVSLADIAQYEEERRAGAVAADVAEREADPH